MFFFKQKTAYEMRISDWSSDVCSSDLGTAPADGHRRRHPGRRCIWPAELLRIGVGRLAHAAAPRHVDSARSHGRAIGRGAVRAHPRVAPALAGRRRAEVHVPGWRTAQAGGDPQGRTAAATGWVGTIDAHPQRSEERRVGKEGYSKVRY